MKQTFFNPFIGENYHKGIKGKRILVLGASFYCNKTECLFFKSCTNTSVKDSSPYDNICPEYKEDGICLHDEPANSIENMYPTYQKFAKGMAKFIGDDDYNSIWNHLAFTNYVQFFLPSNSEYYRETRFSDLSERDFESFIETITYLQPDIVIIWGCVINDRLKEKNIYVINEQELIESDGYICHMQLPGMDKRIALLNPYHPSSSAWNPSLPEFEKQLSTILCQ